jgi:competence protein ComEA
VVREWVEWFGVVRLAVTAGSVLAVGVGAFLLLRPSPPPVEATLPIAGASTTSVDAGVRVAAVPTIATVPTEVVVHVAGAVVSPGVVHLPAGTRVVDALAAAGGAAPDADLDALNLAAVLVDGSRIYVPRPGEVVPSAASPAGAAGVPVPPGPLDLNRATIEQLDELPGVGPATAAAIVAHRDANGPFGSVDDLADVRGIGPAKLDALRALVTV